MPVHKVKGGYKWGKYGKVYKNRTSAENQAKAIYASGYKVKSLNLEAKLMSTSENLYKSLNAAINKLEKAEYNSKGQTSSNGAFDAGGHYDAEFAANNAPPELETNVPNEVPENKINTPPHKITQKPREPAYMYDGDEEADVHGNLEKAVDWKKVAGVGGGAALGGAIGGPLGAAAGGLIGSHLTRNKTQSANAGKVPSSSNTTINIGRSGASIKPTKSESESVPINTSSNTAPKQKRFVSNWKEVGDNANRFKRDVKEVFNPNLKRQRQQNEFDAYEASQPVSHGFAAPNKYEYTPRISSSNVNPNIAAPTKYQASSNTIPQQKWTRRGASKSTNASKRDSIGESGAESWSMDSRLAKCKAEIQLKKAITKIEGYSPMSYLDMVKAFGATEKIPDIMKDEISRPPTAWFEYAIMKSSEIVTDPFGYAIDFWYGKDMDVSKWIQAALAAAPAVAEAGKTVGSTVDSTANSVNNIGSGINKLGTSLKAEDTEYNEDDSEEDNIEKLIGGALLGGAIGSVAGHPMLGASAGAGLEEMGKSLDSADPEKLGSFIIHALKSSEVYQKAVAENIGSKYSPEQRKPKFDKGGESEVSGDGTKVNLHDLADKSKTEKTF